jgi:WD40 repeat protein
MSSSDRCPDCGSALVGSGALGGMCPGCLLDLAQMETESTTESLSLPSLAPAGVPTSLEPGRILGRRYRLLGTLGRGGAGEVWLAFDVKLRVDVALKVLHPELLGKEPTLDLLRQEVRAARQVVSPHVCRVFDLVEQEGHEMVSMEYVEGVTLARLLADRSPLALEEAREIAAQFLAGLEAIHQAGLVHRDFKPENVMVTPAGRTVVMDFGLTRSLMAWGESVIAGTPAYMAPEQAAGRPVDARTDVFAAAVVLAEMTSPEGTGSREARQRLWRDLHAHPPAVPETAWRPVLLRALTPSAADRFPSAGALARALEEMAPGASTAGEDCPYPGLDAFARRDSRFFFGRETEVEALLGRLRLPRLRAVIGPSGAGKSSFLRAGLLAALPAGWSATLCTPGGRPLESLTHTLAARLEHETGATGATAPPGSSGDAEATIDLARTWRARHDQALLIVDQFEELFTLSDEDVRSRFAEILGRLVLEADVHVLLSMRDDFLFRCQSHESLRPIFTELFPLAPLAGEPLRRALVQPALNAGYRFDDDHLVEDMLKDVSHERAALPLVAFAAARLWEKRDRESGLLTRSAYEAIGGVGGGLAQHAEATLERIGAQRTGIVREIFANLVTAEGTRAVRGRDELLSIFPDRQGAEEVLRQLIDARLLTLFEDEAAGTGSAGGPRVEIVHESLLTAWPRIVRWRTQDVEGAQLREQLRSAAHTWEERGRRPDLLWTGTSVREFEIWRERSPVLLTPTEEAFARAMVAHSGRRKRRRRLFLTSAFVAMAAVVGVVVNLWVGSRAAERAARLETRRTAAQQLLAIGQVELRENPSASLAYALASLERDDNRQVRELALQALWHGPTAFPIPNKTEQAYWHLDFSPDGQWLAAAAGKGESVQLWRRDGSPPRSIDTGSEVGFTPDSRFLVSAGRKRILIYGLPDLRPVRHSHGPFEWGAIRGDRLITASNDKRTDQGWDLGEVQAWILPEGPAQPLGTWVVPGMDRFIGLDPSGRSALFAAKGSLYEAPLAPGGARNLRLIGRSDDRLVRFPLVPDDDHVVTWHASGATRVWSRRTGASRLLPSPPVLGSWRVGAMTHDGRWLACANGNDQTVFLWDLAGPPDADPLVLRRGRVTAMVGLAVDPSGSWLVSRDLLEDAFWPLGRTYPYVLRRGPKDQLRGIVAFDPQGHRVAAGGWFERKIWIWPLRAGEEPFQELDAGAAVYSVAFSPDGRSILAATKNGVRLLPLNGGAPTTLPGFEGEVSTAAFDRAGRRVAAAGGLWLSQEAVVRVWDLESGRTQVLDSGDGQHYLSVQFVSDDRLLSGGYGGLRLWDLTTGQSTLLVEGAVTGVANQDGRYVLGVRLHENVKVPVGTAFVYDLQDGTHRDLASHGDQVSFAAWHPSGALVVTGSRDGVVRVGPVTGEEPHLLMGHEGSVWGVSVDPDGRFIASLSEDRSVRLWPLPEGRPLQTLPYPEFLDRLRTLTNYRVVEDATTSTGYRLTSEPFTGWERMPPSW